MAVDRAKRGGGIGSQLFRRRVRRRLERRALRADRSRRRGGSDEPVRGCSAPTAQGVLPRERMSRSGRVVILDAHSVGGAPAAHEPAGLPTRPSGSHRQNRGCVDGSRPSMWRSTVSQRATLESSRCWRLCRVELVCSSGVEQWIEQQNGNGSCGDRRGRRTSGHPRLYSDLAGRSRRSPFHMPGHEDKDAALTYATWALTLVTLLLALGVPLTILDSSKKAREQEQGPVLRAARRHVPRDSEAGDRAPAPR